MVIGFVGLGIMGKPMAKNLCRAGYTLIVNDHHKENVDELVQAGARSGDLKQIGMESDVVITMLPNSPQVKDVMLGENGIAGYMKKGTCFIDMSSINPVDSRYIGDVLKEKGIDMLDAPVSGGEPKAIDGTVAFMVGGDEKTFDKYKQILTHMGSSVTRCGKLGAGNTTKLANQIIVACNIQAVSESFILAKKAGVVDSVTLTGGCAKNEGLKQAIEKVLKVKVVELPVDPQLMGALGAAEYARQKGRVKQ